MSQPTPSDVYVNYPLTNVATIYLQDQTDFVADKVFPMVPVEKQSDLYWQYAQADFMRVDARVRGNGEESAGTGFTASASGTYNAAVLALHKDITAQERANWRLPRSHEQDATQFVTQQMLRKRELDWANAFFTTGKWTGASGGTDITGVASGPVANQVLQWSNDNSNPIKDVQTQRTAILGQTGFTPNKLTITPPVKTALVNNPSVLDRIKYVRAATGIADDLQLLAQAFGVDEVLESKAVYNSAQEGATAAYGFIMGKGALLTFSPPGPSITMPSAGYVFTWDGYLGMSAFGIRLKTIPMPWKEVDRVEADMAYDCHQVAASLGAFFTSIVA
jgi:hypothetical protein